MTEKDLQNLCNQFSDAPPVAYRIAMTRGPFSLGNFSLMCELGEPLRPTANARMDVMPAYRHRGDR